MNIMETQIYLMLCVGDDAAFKKDTLSAAGIVRTLLKNFVLGDSLDVPFVKMIRVQKVSHEIKFPGSAATKKTYSADMKTVTTENDPEKGDARTYDQASAHRGGIKLGKYLSDSLKYRQELRKYNKRVEEEEALRAARKWREYHAYDVGVEPDMPQRTDDAFKHAPVTGKAGWLTRNKFAKSEVPEHESLTFAKHVDNATPQLAFSCASQEPYAFAFFFYRRKAGAGLGGVRQPFFSLGLYKCSIASWSLSGTTETVKLKYRAIAWGSLDTWGDSDKPIGIPSLTHWDTEDRSGGEGPMAWLTLITQLVGQGLTVIAGGASSASLGDTKF